MTLDIPFHVCNHEPGRPGRINLNRRPYMARVLVIDDEKMVRQTLRLALELAGVEVVEAPDGDEGVQVFREAPADLVVADIKMPGKDGLEVIREMKASFSDVKIIAITGYEPESLDEAEDLGAVHTFRKPLRMKEFVETVQALLEEGA